MTDPVPADDGHQEVDELLPWYATGQLDDAERTLVENHLSSCGRCQQQLVAERRLMSEFRTLAPEIDSGWQRMRARIRPPAAPPRKLAQAANDAWSILARPGVAMLAAAQLGFVVLAGGLLLSFERPQYHALGGPPASSQANVLVIFHADATEGDVRDALRRNGASLVGGPTAADAYLIHVPASDRDAALARLLSDDNVELAQPIDGPTQ